MSTAPHPEPIAATPVDPLAEALQPIQMTGAFYCASELTAPWGMTLPPLPGYTWFHVISDGGCELEVEGSSRTMRRGDLVLVPHGTGHVLRSAAGVAAPDILELHREQVSDRYELLRDGGGGERSRMICGAVRFEHPAAQNLVELLPSLIQLAGSASADGAPM